VLESRICVRPWRGLETWHGRDTSANCAPVLDPTGRPFFVPSPTISVSERARGQGRNARKALALCRLRPCVARAADA